MEVTKVNDHVTHAVIGAAKAIDFAIDDSAEFFQILSSTLYKHQKLAMVRETLCNAWDAHIEHGCTDKPIEITLNESHMIIRDHGTGIPKDKIGPIYGTYGGSTKRSNVNVTGGFGLGCKAPFAYADHFEVTSFHDGEKTIYNLSKSNAEVAGKPSIIPMVSVPTTETGIQVKIGIKGHDYGEFLTLISQVIFNGDMNATVNGSKFPTMDLTDMKHNFIILKGCRSTGFNEPVLLRYGHVIYPVEEHSDINNLLGKVKRYLDALAGNGDGYYHRGNNKTYQIVFQAEPNTISVTPSRESLSMKAHTVKTLNDIMLAFLAQIEKFSQQTYTELLQEATSRTTIDVTPATLLTIEAGIANLTRIKEREAEAVLKDYPEISRHYAMNNRNERAAFMRQNKRKRLTALVETGFGDRGLMQTYRRHALGLMSDKKSKLRRELRDSAFWFNRRYRMRWHRMMSRCEDVHIDKLMLYGRTNSDRWEARASKFVPLMKAQASRWHSEDALLNLMKNYVVLSFNQKDIEDQDWSNEAFKYYYNLQRQGLNDCLVYLVPRNPKKVEAARAFFESIGVFVLDLTIAQQEFYESRLADKGIASDAPKKPKKTGIPALSNILVKDTQKIRTILYSASDAKLIEAPKFVLQFADRNDKDSLPNFTTVGTRDLVILFGDQGGFVANVNQEARYIREGAVTLGAYVYPKLQEEILSNPRIMSSYAFNYERFRRSESIYRSDAQTAFNILEEVRELGEYFGIHHLMNEEDKRYLRLFLEMSTMWQIKEGTKERDDTLKALNAVKVDPAMKRFYEIYRPSTAYKVIEEGALFQEFVTLRKDKETKKRDDLRDLFLRLIEG